MYNGFINYWKLLLKYFNIFTDEAAAHTDGTQPETGEGVEGATAADGTEASLPATAEGADPAASAEGAPAAEGDAVPAAPTAETEAKPPASECSTETNPVVVAENSPASDEPAPPPVEGNFRT